SYGGALGRPLESADTAVSVLSGDGLVAELSASFSIRAHNRVNNRDFMEEVIVFGTEGTLHILPTARPSIRHYRQLGDSGEWREPSTRYVPEGERIGFNQFNPEDDP